MIIDFTLFFNNSAHVSLFLFVRSHFFSNMLRLMVGVFKVVTQIVIMEHSHVNLTTMCVHAFADHLF